MIQALSILRHTSLVKITMIKDETRAVMPFVVPKFKSVKFGKRSLNCKGAFLWNILGNSFTSKVVNSHVQAYWSIEVSVVV